MDDTWSSSLKFVRTFLQNVDARVTTPVGSTQRMTFQQTPID